MNTSDNQLPGKVSPRTYTIDEPTMQECLALLKQRTKKH